MIDMGQADKTLRATAGAPFDRTAALLRLERENAELLAALSSLLGALEVDAMDDKSNVYRSMMIDARAAISKATGGRGMNMDLYHCVEVYPVKIAAIDPDGSTCYEICDRNDPDLVMWSVYLRDKDEDFAHCISDCAIEEYAELIAGALRAVYPHLSTNP